MIVSSGYNIGAPEVESAIDQHPDVVENAVIGVPGPGARQHRLRVHRAARRRRQATPRKRKDIQDFVKKTIAPYKYPRDIRFVDELPRNPSGKLQHFKLRDGLFGGGTTSETQELTPAGQSQA